MSAGTGGPTGTCAPPPLPAPGPEPAFFRSPWRSGQGPSQSSYLTFPSVHASVSPVRRQNPRGASAPRCTPFVQSVRPPCSARTCVFTRVPCPQCFPRPSPLGFHLISETRHIPALPAVARALLQWGLLPPPPFPGFPPAQFVNRASSHASQHTAPRRP